MKSVLSSLISTLKKAPAHQSVPSVDANDVARIVRRDFPGEQFETIMMILREYEQVKWSRERPRVQVAALKLAQGKLEVLRTAINRAKQDYRDVLAPAEYPEYTRVGMFQVRNLPLKEQQRILESDWKQYEEWLRR